MVGVGGGEVVLRITGVQKTTKRRRRKSCLWTGLIHRGEEGTKSGYKKTKRGIKILACGQGTTPQRSSAAFLAEKKKLKFLLPSQRTETSHA